MKVTMEMDQEDARFFLNAKNRIDLLIEETKAQDTEIAALQIKINKLEAFIDEAYLSSDGTNVWMNNKAVEIYKDLRGLNDEKTELEQNETEELREED